MGDAHGRAACAAAAVKKIFVLHKGSFINDVTGLGVNNLCYIRY